jgi:hypothetical protein
MSTIKESLEMRLNDAKPHGIQGYRYGWPEGRQESSRLGEKAPPTGRYFSINKARASALLTELLVLLTVFLDRVADKSHASPVFLEMKSEKVPLTRFFSGPYRT